MEKTVEVFGCLVVWLFGCCVDVMMRKLKGVASPLYMSTRL